MKRLIDWLLAGLGLGGKKAEADVSYDPGKPEPGKDDTTLGVAPSKPGHGFSEMLPGENLEP